MDFFTNTRGRNPKNDNQILSISVHAHHDFMKHTAKNQNPSNALVQFIFASRWLDWANT
jgi:hypothetical protein